MSLIFGGSAPLLASLYFDPTGEYDRALLVLAALWAPAACVILLARGGLPTSRVEAHSRRPCPTPH